MVVAATDGEFACEDDYANGGADQFVWNYAAATAREIGQAWREVGAVESPPVS